jgi:4-hydroxy-3-methylbut-2-en-1-yl diphosphate reductase
MPLKVNIDRHSGFCFGVRKAIELADEILSREDQLYCLGEIVHNSAETIRLEKRGLKTISYNDFKKLKDTSVFVRAHGEPPETFNIARENNLTLINATCPVVTKLQQKVRTSMQNQNNRQMVIYGKKGHPEVIGLCGHAYNKAIVIEELGDIESLPTNKNIILYSQTTMNGNSFDEFAEKIKERLQDGLSLEIKNSICGAVSNRIPILAQFAGENDLILFVAGKTSSNGRMLYETCKTINQNIHYLSDADDIKPQWFKNNSTVGVCGATSTPQWLIQKVADTVKDLDI